MSEHGKPPAWRRHGFLRVFTSSEPNGVEAVPETPVRLLALIRALRELPELTRRVFLLKKIHGLSQREIAARLGISEGAVEKHIARGLLLCSRALKALGSAEPSVHGVSTAGE